MSYSASLVGKLKTKLKAKTDHELCYLLNITSPTLVKWRQDKGDAESVARAFKKLATGAIDGKAIIARAQKAFECKTLRELSEKLGVNEKSIQNWKSRRFVTSRQIVELISSARKSEQKATLSTAIRPLVEFFPVEKVKNKKRFEVFSIVSNGKEHPYRKGLREELKAHSGVYIFFDSRGQAIYAGKAQKLKLWRELNNALNRNRNELQTIRRVGHPNKRVAYQTSEERFRQIRNVEVPLHAIAYYFSAYQVVDGMVDVVESLLVRSFANDLLNKKMEKFGKRRSTSRPKKRRRRKSTS